MRCIKELCLIVLIFLGSNTLLAQETPVNRHVISYIRYDDGSSFIGNIVKSNQEETVLIVNTGDSIHLDNNRIRRLRIIIVDNNVVFKQKGKFFYKKGIFASFDSGYSFFTETEDVSMQTGLLIGYRLDERTAFGLGTGFHVNTFHVNAKHVNSIWVENQFTAVYAYGRRYFGGGNVAPFIFGNFGYGFPVSGDFIDNHSGGVYVQPGVGLHFASRGKFRFITSLSGYIQHTKGSQDDRDFVFNTPIEVDYSIWYSRLMLKVGIELR